jgi:acyl-CoA synthetase (AMP-forming)/AMP-acid ligase II
VAVYTRAAVTSWGDLARLFDRVCSEYDALAGAAVGLSMRPDALGIAALAAFEQLDCQLFLLDHQWPADRQQQVANQFGLRAVVDPLRSIASDDMAQGSAPANEAVCRGVDRGSLTILTSGTTGAPKAVRHDWARLARPVRQRSTGPPPRWLLAYRPHLYAGLQVILQALLNGGTLVAPQADEDANAIAQLMVEARVEFVSATPSYWRQLLLWADPQLLSAAPLQQITLGGEVVDQSILDRLRAAFPGARIVHIYATTELGRCFSVTDGISGFPRSYLEQLSADGVELSVREQQLWVRSQNAMIGYQSGKIEADATAPEGPSGVQGIGDGWFATGDLVEIVDDRVQFVGRLSDVINVGGNKVYPLAVEQVIRQLPEVAEVRVFAQSSSVAGQLVACQIVAQSGDSTEFLRQRVLEHCRSRLDRFHCPRLVEVVPELGLSDAGKLRRTPIATTAEESAGTRDSN